MGLKYEDYVKSEENVDEIQDEIKEASEATEIRRNIPDSVRQRFDGKSVDEILEIYANAERKISEQGETIGKLRKTSDQLIELQLHSNNKPAGEDTDDPVEEPLTVDDLYDDADGAITKRVEKATAKQRQEVNDALAELRASKVEAALTTAYPEWRTDVNSSEFNDWVNASSYRQRLMAAGHQYDFDAANDLLSMWNDHKNRSQELEQSRKRERQLDDATLESSSPEGFEPEESYSRSEIMENKIAAKQGNRKAEAWVRKHSAAINLAYAEGRITD